MGITGLVTIATLNLERLTEFYTQVLGITPHLYSPPVYAEFQVAGLRLGIFVPRAGDRSEFPIGASAAISLCLEVENLAEGVNQLTALGYPPPGAVLAASHGHEIYAYDPDGNRLILYQQFKP